MISPLAYVSKYSFIDEGTVVMQKLYNKYKSFDCHISTASIINGGVVVKNDSFVGSNSTSKQAIDGFIKAGSLAK